MNKHKAFTWSKRTHIMINSELKNSLLKEHSRDKKLSFLGFFLVIGFLILFTILIIIFAFEHTAKVTEEISQSFTQTANNGASGFFYRTVTPVAFGLTLLYPLFIFLKLKKRPQKINKLMALIDQGEIATSITQRTVYKITIPFLKINFKLAPVEYVTIHLQDSTSYDLPIPLQLVPELKNALSGIDKVKSDSLWHELYINTDVNTTSIETPLKTLEEYDNFISNELDAEINHIDKNQNSARKLFKKYSLLSAIIIVAIGSILFFSMFKNGSLDTNVILIIAVTIGAISSFFYLRHFITSKQLKLLSQGGDFKTSILKRTVEFINPKFLYILHGHISLPELMEMGLLEKKQYILEGNDQIIGQHQGVPFQISDLEVQYKRNLTRENETPDEVFYGQAFVAKFNKDFKSDIYVIARRNSKQNKSDATLKKLVKAVTNGNADTKSYLRTSDFGDKIILEDPEFIKQFHVYCDDPVEARYILTTAMMGRIKTLANKSEGSLFMSFRNDKISILNNSGKNNFEPGMFTSFSENQHSILKGFYQDLCDQLSIIEDLKLNINIWTK